MTSPLVHYIRSPMIVSIGSHLNYFLAMYESGNYVPFSIVVPYSD